MHTKQILPLFLVIITLSALALSKPVDATNYNWILNPSFEYSTDNYILNPSFEEGSKNWTISGGSAVSGSYAYDGVNSTYLTGAGENAYQEFSPAISVANITGNLFWAMFKSNDLDGHAYALFAYYNDSSNDYVYYVETDTAWFNMSLALDLGKFVYRITVAQWAGSGYDDMWVDNVVMRSTEGFEPTGQSDIESYTYPWWTARNDTYVSIRYGYGHTGLYAGYIQNTYYTDQKLIQDISYLSSNSVNQVSMYALVTAGASASYDVYVKVFIIYSDRTYSQKNSILFSNEDGYTFLNFTNFLVANKLITQIQILPVMPQGYDIVIDDVVLQSTIDYGATGVFSWMLSPAPISYTNLSFLQYMGIQCDFTGYVYNSTGYGETGVFSVILMTGTLNGTITNGIFTFTISARTGAGDLEESLIISVNTVEQDFTTIILAHWTYIDAIDPNDPTQNSGGMANWIVMFFGIFFPAIVLAGVFKNYEMSAVIGFIVGLTLSTSLMFWAGLVPLWMLFVFVICIIVLILAMLKGRGV